MLQTPTIGIWRLPDPWVIHKGQQNSSGKTMKALVRHLWNADHVAVQIEDELHVEGGLLRAGCSCDAVKTGCEREKCVWK
jgi:hypothetical protein